MLPLSSTTVARCLRHWKKNLIALLTLLSITVFSLDCQAQDGNKQTIGIGFQKGSGLLSILKQNGSLEKALKPLGYQVRWIEFPAGPQLLEALNAGSVDFGLTGAPPPVFAQAAGIDLLYVGAEPPSPSTEAIVVPQQSPLHSVAQLKGKKVAFQKGSSGNFLIVDALENAGLHLSDIQPIYLSPADARAAFISGSVDAWVIWDPYLAAAQKSLQVRVLTDHHGLLQVYSYYEASRRLAQGAPQALSLILAQLDSTGVWASNHLPQVIALIAADLGIAPDVVDTWQRRTAYGVKPISAAMISSQQQVADRFYRLKLIPKAVTISQQVWHWQPATPTAP